jgi:hypothetical protein
MVPADMPVVGPLAEAILSLCRKGFLSATSIGFQPLEYEVAQDRNGTDDSDYGINFLRQELTEISICSVPANAEALILPTEILAALDAAPKRLGTTRTATRPVFVALRSAPPPPPPPPPAPIWPVHVEYMSYAERDQEEGDLRQWLGLSNIDRKARAAVVERLAVLRNAGW